MVSPHLQEQVGRVFLQLMKASRSLVPLLDLVHLGIGRPQTTGNPSGKHSKVGLQLISGTGSGLLYISTGIPLTTTATRAMDIPVMSLLSHHLPHDKIGLLPLNSRKPHPLPLPRQ
jgi:hypothetical protein